MLKSTPAIFPKLTSNESRTVSIGASALSTIFVPFNNITKPVIVHTTIVSMNTSAMPRKPCSQGESVLAVACAMGEVPHPASFENSPLIVPNRSALKFKKPTAPAPSERNENASSNMSENICGNLGYEDAMTYNDIAI